jgi:hypothetical protein
MSTYCDYEMKASPSADVIARARADETRFRRRVLLVVVALLATLGIATAVRSVAAINAPAATQSDMLLFNRRLTFKGHFNSPSPDSTNEPTNEPTSMPASPTNEPEPTIIPTNMPTKECPFSCLAAKESGMTTSGLYNVCPTGDSVRTVLCDQ